MQYHDNSVAITSTPSLDYTNFAINWSTILSSSSWQTVALSATGQYMIAGNTILYYSVNYGQTWTQSSGITGNIVSIAMSASGQYVVACTTANGIYYSSTYGQTWLQSNASASIQWYRICISASGQNVFAVGAANTLYYSSNYGQTWTALSSTSGSYGGVACSASGQYIIAGIISGGIYYSSTYGQTWTISNISSAGTITYAAMSASGQYAIVVTNGSGIYYSSNYGVTFVNNTVLGTSNLNSISISSSGQYQVTSVTNGIYYSSNYGQTWSQSNVTGNWIQVALSSTGQYILGCISGGLVYLSITPFLTLTTSGNMNTQTMSIASLTYNDGSTQVSSQPLLGLSTFSSPLYTTGNVYIPGTYSATNPGFITLPGGLIMQFGTGSISPNYINTASATVTFYKPFPNICYSVVISVSDLASNLSGVSGTTPSYIQFFPMANTVTRTNFILQLKFTPPPLYSFTFFTFTSNVTGSTGPTSLSYYNTSTYPWINTYLTLSSNLPGVQIWIPPVTGYYLFQVYGAGAGISSTPVGYGYGTIIKSTLFLTQGSQIYILVGQTSQYGGGGGTFVCQYNGGATNLASSYTVLLVASGGGGALFSSISGIILNGPTYTLTPASSPPNQPMLSGSFIGTLTAPANATGGNGGNVGSVGSGGGGFLTNGAGTYPGSSFLNGGTGGGGSSPGGFGGGGGYLAGTSAGGGGGYSGGCGSANLLYNSTNYAINAGSGGSYDINGAGNNATRYSTQTNPGVNGQVYVSLTVPPQTQNAVTYNYIAYGN